MPVMKVFQQERLYLFNRNKAKNKTLMRLVPHKGFVFILL